MPISSKHLADPELLPLLDFFPPLELNDEILPTVRAMAPRLQDDPSVHLDVEIIERSIAGPRGAPQIGVVIY